MRPVDVRWARIGPKSRRWLQHVPRAGMCLSVFLVVRNKSGAILFGRPEHHRAWPEKGCVPFWRLDDLIEEKCWVLPASHLLMEEPPDHAARRVARDWAGLAKAKLKLLGVDSSSLPGVLWEGRGKTRRATHHWAIGFVYEARSDLPPPSGPWWKETRFVPVGELPELNIGRAHRDLLRYAQMDPNRRSEMPRA